MALHDYTGALEQGRKQHQASTQEGEYPYLPALGDTLSYTEAVLEVNLGIIDIPLERIVGTRTEGRTSIFANDFMPLLGEESGFGTKWAYLCDHQIEGGIHDLIIAYELMNQFYAQEGNKRASVPEYSDALSASSQVTRLIPRRSDDRDIKLCYEFLDFYQVSFNCDV